MSPTGKLTPLDGSTDFAKKSVVRGREFKSPLVEMTYEIHRLTYIWPPCISVG